MKKIIKIILILLLFDLFSFEIFADNGGNLKNSFYFLNNGHTSISFIDRFVDKRAYGDYGWETNVSGGFYLIGYKDFFLSFDGIIQTISKNRPFGVDFLSVNYNLVPAIGYKTTGAFGISKHKIKFIVYHWSLHYFNSEFKDLDNINLLGPNYSYFDNAKLLNIFIGIPAFKNDYKYKWDFQILYRQSLWDFVYFSSFMETAKVSDRVLLDQKFESGFYFNKEGNSIELFLGYSTGKILPPKGFYWGLRMNF